MSIGPELLPQNNPELWGGPWYISLVTIFAFLTIIFIVAFAERQIFDRILFSLRTAGTQIELNNLHPFKPHISESGVEEGYKWLANNTEVDATVLAWWDYAGNIEKQSHRNVVITSASRNIRDTIESRHKHSWSWIKYALWYPFESGDKVKEVANFFAAESEMDAIEIAREYNAKYVLVNYPGDVYKFKAMVLAAGKNPDDYIATKVTPQEIENRTFIKRETFGIKMFYGDEVEGFEKVFDNRMMRIYKLRRGK